MIRVYILGLRERMIKKIFTIALFFVSLPVFAAVAANKENCADFKNMTKLWCTVDYKHWAISYANSINYDEVDFYLYLDEPNHKVYNQNKEEVAEVVSYDDKEIKFINKYHVNKRTYVENYTLDRYTGRAKGKGTIRHDLGKLASITYENRDFNAKGQCAVVDEVRKF